MYYVGIDLNHMLFAMRNLHGLLDCLLHFCRNILMSLLLSCMYLEVWVFLRIYQIMIDFCYHRYYWYGLYGILMILNTLLPFFNTLESFIPSVWNNEMKSSNC